MIPLSFVQLAETEGCIKGWLGSPRLPSTPLPHSCLRLAGRMESTAWLTRGHGTPAIPHRRRKNGTAAFLSGGKPRGLYLGITFKQLLGVLQNVHNCFYYGGKRSIAYYPSLFQFFLNVPIYFKEEIWERKRLCDGKQKMPPTKHYCCSTWWGRICTGSN